MKKISTLFFATTLLFSAPNKQQEEPSILYPLNMTKESQVFSSPEQIKSHFEINIDEMAVKKVQNRKERYEAIMDDVFDAEILSQPLVKKLKTMDTLYAHPSFISLIKLPIGMKIVSAKTAMAMEDFTYSENILTFSPKKNAQMGNIIITAFDSEVQKNKVFNFIVKKYSNNEAKYDKEYGLYATNNGEFLSLTIFYTQIQKVDEIKLLQKYVEVNGLKTFKKQFEKNGDTESILLDGVPIFITRDDHNGNISYYDMDFRITIGGK